jgi:hypothetical protein
VYAIIAARQMRMFYQPLDQMQFDLFASRLTKLLPKCIAANVNQWDSQSSRWG